MATYNGESFVAEQLDSILKQLSIHDEVVVVDDGSTDRTPEILKSYQDPRIRLYLSPRNQGVVAAFEAAMSLARGDVLLLSDQDDHWLPGRVSVMVGAMRRTSALIVASNWSYMDAAHARTRLRARPLQASDSDRHFTNIWRVFSGTAAYYGCGMALHRSVLELVLPIPKFVESHDLWIAMAGNMVGVTTHVEDNTLARRVHERNASGGRRSLYQKLRARWIMARSAAVILARRPRLAIRSFRSSTVV